jgi:hypothetical protein
MGRTGEPRSGSVAVIAAPAVLVVMYPIFQVVDVAGELVEGYLGWAAGLAVYWLLWGWPPRIRPV